jgi:hypothetical protein
MSEQQVSSELGEVKNCAPEFEDGTGVPGKGNEGDERRDAAQLGFVEIGALGAKRLFARTGPNVAERNKVWPVLTFRLYYNLV